MIKLALPAGDLRGPLAEVLSAAGLTVQGYGEGSRQYRLAVPSDERLKVRVFREKDIPIQVALGNYDVGITSVAWVREMQAKFPGQPVVPLASVGIGAGGIFAAAAPSVASTLGDIAKLSRVRIASEYPNIAEALARALRLPSYRIHGVWGAAQAYPPEDADLVVIPALDEAEVRSHGLTPLFQLMDNSAWVVANAAALASKDLGRVLGRLLPVAANGGDGALLLPGPLSWERGLTPHRPAAGLEARPAKRENLRLAVPDGHQQRHVVAALRDAGLAFDGYDEGTTVRRPASGIDGLDVKVVRPQDMPQLVAYGEFDLAITGRDLLNEHLFQFPSSPAYELADLQRAQYDLSAVVSQEEPAQNIGELMDGWRRDGKRAITVAAEFPATADHYARSRHFWRYQVIPIAGASEGFVPEDADLLIEGTETGKTIAENNLKVIDLLYRSTTALIGSRAPHLQGRRRAVHDEVVGALRTSVLRE